MNSDVVRRFARLHILVIFIFWQCSVLGLEYRYQAASSKHIFGVSSAPRGAKVILFVSDSAKDEELDSGVPSIVDLETSQPFPQPKVETLAVDSKVAWTNDGLHVFFETTKGLVECSTIDPAVSPRLIQGGETHGVALSADDQRVAFWKKHADSFDLIIKNVGDLTVARRWLIPFNYGGEANGFEIAFGSPATLYARTFDDRGRTPLRRFSLATGRVQTIEQDCLSLATGETGIYYIANLDSRRVLKKIVGSGIKALLGVATYDDLQPYAGGRWIGLAGETKSAVLDSRSDRISLTSHCASIVVLPNEAPLFVRGRGLSSDSSSCPK